MAGKIPKAFIDEILERTSLVDYIDSHVSLKKRGKNYLACCPFHNEKTPSFNVIPDKQFYYCFGCGASGNAISFAMNHLKKDFVSAVEELAELVGMPIPREKQNSSEINAAKKVYGFLDEVAQVYHQCLTKTELAAAYLRGRRIDRATIDYFNIGFAVDDWHFLSKTFPANKKELIDSGMLVQNDKGNIYDRYRNRIMFPIQDKRGRVVGFGGRVIQPEDKPKYLNSPETAYFHKSKELYGLYQVQQIRPESIVVVEGYLDVVSLYQHGINNAVAALGTATTEFHIRALFKTAKKVIFCFDGDQAGRRAAERSLQIALPIIQDDESVQFMFLPEGEDPDSLVQGIGKEAFLQQLTQALSMPDYFMQMIKGQVDIQAANGKAQLVHAAKPYLKEMAKNALRAILIKKLSLITYIDESQLNTIMEGRAEVPQFVAPPQHNSVSRKRQTQSAMRTALAILIQNPNLFLALEDKINFALLKQNNNPVMGELLNVLKDTKTTAQIIEHWRHNEHAAVITKLACLPLNIPEEGLLGELTGALQQIEKKTLQTQIDSLLYKANMEGLSQEEKKVLQNLIKERKSFSA